MFHIPIPKLVQPKPIRKFYLRDMINVINTIVVQWIRKRKTVCTWHLLLLCVCCQGMVCYDEKTYLWRPPFGERIATEGILITCVVIIICLSHRMRRLNYDRTKHYPHSFTIISIIILDTFRDWYFAITKILLS